MTCRVLVTNDDGFDSQLLPFTLDSVREAGDITVVVPGTEQSWRGKAISRFDALKYEERTLEGRRVGLFHGTPADCVNFGLHHVCGGTADLVVSGVNTGLNVGHGFMLSSGTIGACFEANIAGVPAIAFSQVIDEAIMRDFYVTRCLPQLECERIQVESTPLVRKVIRVFKQHPELFERAMTWSVNLPVRVDSKTDIKVCSVSNSGYGNVFAKKGDLFQHSLTDVFPDMAPDSDWALVIAGSVTITPIDTRAIGRCSTQESESFSALFV